MHQARYPRAVKLTDRKCVKTMLELIVPELWFNAYHKHYYKIHTGLKIGSGVWAGMTNVQAPWWRSTLTADKKHVFTYGKGV